MTDKEIESAINPFCHSATMNEEGSWVWKFPTLCYFSPLTDLNACAEFELVLDLKEQVQYAKLLHPNNMGYGPLIRDFFAITATPRKRCEVFLRVKNLWKD